MFVTIYLVLLFFPFNFVLFVFKEDCVLAFLAGPPDSNEKEQGRRANMSEINHSNTENHLNIEPVQNIPKGSSGDLYNAPTFTSISQSETKNVDSSGPFKKHNCSEGLPFNIIYALEAEKAAQPNHVTPLHSGVLTLNNSEHLPTFETIHIKNSKQHIKLLKKASKKARAGVLEKENVLMSQLSSTVNYQPALKSKFLGTVQSEKFTDSNKLVPVGLESMNSEISEKRKEFDGMNAAAHLPLTKKLRWSEKFMLQMCESIKAAEPKRPSLPKKLSWREKYALNMYGKVAEAQRPFQPRRSEHSSCGNEKLPGEGHTSSKYTKNKVAQKKENSEKNPTLVIQDKPKEIKNPLKKPQREETSKESNFQRYEMPRINKRHADAIVSVAVDSKKHELLQNINLNGSSESSDEDEKTDCELIAAIKARLKKSYLQNIEKIRTLSNKILGDTESDILNASTLCNDRQKQKKILEKTFYKHVSDFRNMYIIKKFVLKKLREFKEETNKQDSTLHQIVESVKLITLAPDMRFDAVIDVTAVASLQEEYMRQKLKAI